MVPSAPCCALLCPSMPCSSPVCPVMPQHALICPSMTCYAPSVPCCALLCSSMPGYAPAHPAVPCYAAVCPAVPCYAPSTPCCALLCPNMPCCALLCPCSRAYVCYKSLTFTHLFTHHPVSVPNWIIRAPVYSNITVPHDTVSNFCLRTSFWNLGGRKLFGHLVLGVFFS